jgi:streptogramin lyase
LIRLLFLLLFITTTIYSQQLGTWKNYTSMRNVKIASASEDFLWAATDGGIFSFSRADSSYKLYTKSEGLNSQNVTSIAIDNSGNVWSGTTEGYINIINPFSNEIISILDIAESNFPQKAINAIFISGDTCFASTDFGVTAINIPDYAIIESYNKFGNFPSAIKAISLIKRDLIYVATENGVAIQKSDAVNLSSPESWDTYSLGTDISANQVFKVDQFDQGLIASTNNGLYFFNGESWQQRFFAGQNIIDFISSNDSIFTVLQSQLFSIFNDQTTLLETFSFSGINSMIKTNKWLGICYDNGIYDFNTQNNYLPNGPNANSFLNMDVDNSGNLWAASSRDVSAEGFYKLENSKWQNFNITTNPELQSNAFHNVFAAPDNTIYFCNWGNGFTRLKNGVFETFNTQNTDLEPIPESNSFLVIRDAATDSNNDLWLLNFWTSTDKVLSLFTQNNNWYHFSPPFNIILTENLLIDRNNTKWFANKNEDLGGLGLYYFNENGTPDNVSDDIWGSYRKSTNGLNDDAITALALDKRGEIWIGTPLGINVIFDPSNFGGRVQSLFGSISQQSITCIEVDELNQKWVGTIEGVFVLSPDGSEQIQQFNTQNSPLPTNEILSITINDNTGIVYIGTSQGLTSLKTTSIKPNNTFDDIFVYPNPLLLEENNNTLVISGLVRESEIKILTISGKLVKEFITPGGSIATWDGKDDKGRNVPSGVYLIIAYDTEASLVATTKVAVLKK